MAVKKRGLGRGLDALLSGPTVSSLEEQAVKVDQSELQHLPLDLIQRGKYQPRRDMDPQALEELASSIRTQGVITPTSQGSDLAISGKGFFIVNSMPDGSGG